LDPLKWDARTIGHLRVSRLSAGTNQDPSLPFVSVILPTVGRSSLESSIRTILKSDYPRFELLVVKDEQRLGSSIARNVGLKTAKGDVILFAEDDCEYVPSNVRALVDKYLAVRAHDPRCAGIVGSFLPPVWGSTEVMIRISTPPQGIKVTVHPGEGPTDYLATGNALCSKEIIAQCGGFNEEYSHMFEDLELSLILKREGFTIYNCPQAVALHRNEPRGEKSSVRLSRRTSYLRARNAVLIHKTWCGNPLIYAARRLTTDLVRSISHLHIVDAGSDVHWERSAERRRLLDRVAYVFGIANGLVSKPRGRQQMMESGS
jgi:GT2 family glycosyltransferase